MSDQQILLRRLIGRWRGRETMHETPWAAAGAAQSAVEAAWDLGGAFIFQSYRQMRDGAPAFEARSVFGFDQSAGHALMYLFDTMGFMPMAPAVGVVEGEELVFTRHSLRGRGQHRYAFADDGSYRLTIAFAPPDGSFGTVMAGHYHPIPSV
ncbi:DUF1579 family protein [Labrys neptuniae]